jgi:hypothetical protein
LRLVAAANCVKIICDQEIRQKKGFSLGNLGFLPFFNLDWTLMGLPITGDTVDDLMGAFSAGAGFV